MPDQHRCCGEAGKRMRTENHNCGCLEPVAATAKEMDAKKFSGALLGWGRRRYWWWLIYVDLADVIDVIDVSDLSMILV